MINYFKYLSNNFNCVCNSLYEFKVKHVLPACMKKVNQNLCLKLLHKKRPAMS